MPLVLPLAVYQDESYNDLRRGYLLLIASLITEYLTDGDAGDHVEMIISVEKSCYDHSIEIADYELLTPDFAISAFEQLYRTRVMRITKNLDINSEVGDEYLATGLLDGSIEASTVSKLSNRELSPLHNEKYFEALNNRLNQKVSVKTSSLYRCRKCGRRETTVKSVQMRSLDEPQTLIINCTYCSYRWFL